jgi:hypothetical protein
MAAMPCCPDQPATPDPADPGLLSDASVACAPMAGSALLSAEIELPAQFGLVLAAHSDWHGLDPPQSIPPAATPAVTSGLPLYLTTLRLRI